LRRYETTFIVNPQADDATIDKQVTAVLDLIKNNGGTIVRENRMGTRKLAYPIAGLPQGFYASVIFDSEAGVLPQLDRLYQIEEPYIRYLTILYDGPTEPVEYRDDRDYRDDRGGYRGGRDRDFGGPRRGHDRDDDDDRDRGRRRSHDSNDDE